MIWKYLSLLLGVVFVLSAFWSCDFKKKDKSKNDNHLRLLKETPIIQVTIRPDLFTG